MIVGSSQWRVQPRSSLQHHTNGRPILSGRRRGCQSQPPTLPPPAAAAPRAPARRPRAPGHAPRPSAPVQSGQPLATPCLGGRARAPQRPCPRQKGLLHLPRAQRLQALVPPELGGNQRVGAARATSARTRGAHPGRAGTGRWAGRWRRRARPQRRWPEPPRLRRSLRQRLRASRRHPHRGRDPSRPLSCGSLRPRSTPGSSPPPAAATNSLSATPAA
mmetsp:Transcript_97302/g.275323  ORF Transcript_97302/g.275323 Transcript_97302/m.275323 type:complete len:218 (-) Transcript_97302:573-1226(-)